MLDCGVVFKKIASTINHIKIDAALITHEHGDHSEGIKTLLENKDVKIYGSNGTLSKLNIPYSSQIIINSQVEIGTFSIVPFKVEHDAEEPFNYLIYNKISNTKMLYLTDTGCINHITVTDIDYMIIECNFDEEWYKGDLTPEQEIKKHRLMSNKGHLSIQQTIDYIKQVKNHNTKKIVLCHISSSYDGYKEFEKRVTEATGLDVVALDNHMKEPIIIEFKENLDIPEFE
jgi:phosphoribosyl 1,2-cyclic phosphodiesterase